MPDPLTPDDLDAILRGGGSATDKLQRAARMALEKRAMGKDLLTEEECDAIGIGYWCSADMLQRAARLGAERERERAAVIAWNHYMDTCKKQGIAPASMEHWIASAAIRRGEGE